MNTSSKKWKHPGGKLRDCGPKSLTDTELLSVVISSGIKGKSAEEIAKDLLAGFGSLQGVAHQSLDRFLAIKGLGAVKSIRIAAAFELAQRLCGDLFPH